MAHVYNHWAKKIAEADVPQFVDRLITDGKLSETGSAGYVPFLKRPQILGLQYRNTAEVLRIAHKFAEGSSPQAISALFGEIRLWAMSGSHAILRPCRVQSESPERRVRLPE